MWSIKYIDIFIHKDLTMDSFATHNSTSTMSSTILFSSHNALEINDPIIFKYINSQYPLIHIPDLYTNTMICISKIGSLEKISTKLNIIRNREQKTDFLAKNICSKIICSKMRHIVYSISKYWQIIDFDYYNYDIFEIDTIPGFYIVERCFKDWSKKHTHKHPLDSDEIVRIFIHNEVVLIHTTY